jgi:GxxExxY protein
MHKELGPGLLESVYQAVMAGELVERGLSVEQNRTVPFEFRGRTYHKGLRVDLLVDGLVVVELKSVETLAAVHWKQVLTYLRLLNLPVGLLINFGAATLKEGLKRVVNNYQAPASRTSASRPSASPRLRVSHWDSYRKGER